MGGLTPKQEKFAQCVASGMNQSDAYRAAYSVRPTTKPETVNEQGSRIMAARKVSARIEELRQPIVEKMQLTLKEHLDALKTLRDQAAKEGQYSAAITAEIARGRHAGITAEIAWRLRDRGDDSRTIILVDKYPDL